MKELADGKMVDADAYHFLLAWNEKNNRKEIEQRFGTIQLCKLKHNEFKQLFLVAMTETYKNI